MRLNPDYFDDSEEESQEKPKNYEFKKVYIDDFSDLPEEQMRELEAMRDKVATMVENEIKNKPERDPLLTYIALLALQTYNLTRDQQKMFNNASLLAEGLDKAYSEINNLGGSL